MPEPDRDSVDVRTMAGGPRRPALDLQLKATTELAEAQDGFRRLRLGIKNYDDLRVETQTPRLPRGAVPAVGRGAVAVSPAACSLRLRLREPQPVYRAGANREAADLLRQMRLGQTNQGSFVVTLLTPNVPRPIPALFPNRMIGTRPSNAG